MSVSTLADQYNEFQRKVGAKQEDTFEVIPRLFSPNFRKIANGSELVNGCAHLQKQLEDIRELTGGWQVEVKKQIPSADNHHCLIRYHLLTVKLGTFDIMALLTTSDGRHIEGIDEVYYTVEE